MKSVFGGSIKIWGLLLCICVLVSGCGVAEPDFGAVYNGFDCRVSWSFGGTELVADVSVWGAEKLEMSICAPALLHGTRLEADKENARLYYGDIELLQEPCDRYLSVMSLLLPKNGFKYICSEDALRLYQSGENVWYFENGLPVKIKGGQWEVKLLSFEYK